MRYQIDVENSEVLEKIAAIEGVKILDDKTEKYSKEIIDALPTPCYIKDKNLRYIDFNKHFEEISGYKKHDLVNKTAFDVFGDKMATIFNASDKELLEKKVHVYETDVRLDSGILKHVIFYKTVLIDDNGNFDGIIGIIIDITDQKELEDSLKFTHAQLEEKNKLLLKQSKLAAMGEMISMIAHQWRQPLNAISITAQSIKIKKDFGKLTDTELVQSVDKISHLISHLSNTIDDFKDFFKNDKKRVEINIANLIDEVLIVLGSSIKHYSINFTLKDECKRKFPIFKNEMIQVLLNLFNNSIDALKEKKEKREIIVNCKFAADTLVIKIHDNGGGIQQEVLDKIFDPYFSTKQKNGTGLGLYMSKIIIEEHLKGKIDVQNYEDGALFTLRLPISTGLYKQNKHQTF